MGSVRIFIVLSASHNRDMISSSGIMHAASFWTRSTSVVTPQELTENAYQLQVPSKPYSWPTQAQLSVITRSSVFFEFILFKKAGQF